MSLLQQATQWLKAHTQDPRKALARFTQGGFLFAGGILLLVLAEKLIAPSLHQELVALAALILAVTGGAIALWGYLSISLFKIILYMLDPDESHHERDGH